jgi:VIT1/CCC1 family predicted Fe2+/Mn2+ transporter
MMRGVAGRITQWVRPHVPDASDGILTSAGTCEGFAGAGVGTKVLIFAGFAGLVAGTLAAGAPEYSKLGAERDQQVSQLTSERVQLETAPDAELDELTQLYVSRGLSYRLAREVAVIPWLAIVLIPGPPRAAVTFVIVLLALALTGWISAQISDVHPVRPIVRTAACQRHPKTDPLPASEN